MPRGRPKQYDFHGLGDNELDFLSSVFSIVRHTSRTIRGEWDEDKDQILREIKYLARQSGHEYNEGMESYSREMLARY